MRPPLHLLLHPTLVITFISLLWTVAANPLPNPLAPFASSSPSAAAASVPSPHRPDHSCRINWNGTFIKGTPLGDACRYTVRYGQADRWSYATPSKGQQGQNAAQFPLRCPQHSSAFRGAGSPKGYSEDCLFMTVYTPKNATSASALPVLVWVHGGSYVEGSASDAGLNGSSLSPAAGIVIVFVQYRLGILGFLPPHDAPTSPDPNFGLTDVILALKVVHDNIRVVGGDAERVTLAGQSAGASMVRSIWGAPAARELYHGMILHSDPMNFGTQSPTDQKALQNFVFSNATLGNCTTYACFTTVDVEKLLSVQDYAVRTAPSKIPTIPIGETFRPQFATVTLPQDPTNALFYNPTALGLDLNRVPVMFTSVRNESGYLIQQALPVPLPGSEKLYNMAINSFVGNQTQTDLMLNSGQYPLLAGEDGLRVSVETLLTDAVWRCPMRDIATQMSKQGGRVYVGEWTRGISYTFNLEGYCATGGAVCHCDDIYPTFASGPNASATAEADLGEFEALVRSHWSAFIHTGTPATPDHPWTQWTSSSTVADIRNIGGSFSVRDCPHGPNIYGSPQIPWMWQANSNATNVVLGAGPSVRSDDGSKPRPTCHATRIVVT